MSGEPEKIVHFPLIGEERGRAGARGGERASERPTRRVSERARARLAARPFYPSNGRLARWLTEKGVSGAQAIVDRYGARAVANALHDGIVVWKPPHRDWEGPHKGTWIMAAKWTNPGGMLIKLLRDADPA